MPFAYSHALAAVAGLANPDFLLGMDAVAIVPED